ncbi:MAG: hypothetical protein U1F16_17365 [Turneriella sp.]
MGSFPVDYNRTVVKPARLSLQLNANSTQASYALKMLRNVGNINDALGTPLREKHRTTKQITLHSATYQETGKGVSSSMRQICSQKRIIRELYA